MQEAYLEMLGLGYFEAQFAFEGLADENVWKRPSEGLLSVGELAGHIAYWGATKLAGDGGYSAESVLACPVKSLLIDPRFRYYTTTLANPPSERQLAMTAAQVWSELSRVYAESIAHFKAQNFSMTSVIPDGEPHETYAELLKYQVFHVSYHIGQMFTVRHLLGEETPDN